VVDSVFHTEEIVVKPMSTKLRHIAMFSGNTILGDGSVIMIIDPNGIAEAIGTLEGEESEDEAEARSASADKMVSMLVFRAGSPELKAVPLSLVTRLEEIDCKKIEFSNGRHLVQYRGQLMPLVRVDETARIRGEGTQPLLVFSEGGRSMGLAVDEIVDIVEDKLDIEVVSSVPGVLGSAVVKGQATEIVDVGHYLPLAFEDWLTRRELRADALTRNLLLVDDSHFFRNMLAPVLKAAGYEVTTATGADEALGRLKAGERFDVIVSDIEMPGMNGFEFAEAVRRDARTARVPIIALSAVASPATIERGRQAGFHEFVAKFDRPGLIAALKESTVEWNEAA
jgi:two-component system, chemotaxis family, sensor kinase CheA